MPSGLEATGRRTSNAVMVNRSDQAKDGRIMPTRQCRKLSWSLYTMIAVDFHSGDTEKRLESPSTFLST